MSADLRRALRLYLVADRGFPARVPFLTAIGLAVEGGVTMVQLRDKGADARAFLRETLVVRDMLRRSGVKLIVNDRIDVALAAGADGVHLGQSDLPPSLARRMLGPQAIIGLSIETEAQLAQYDFSCNQAKSYCVRSTCLKRRGLQSDGIGKLP